MKEHKGKRKNIKNKGKHFSPLTEFKKGHKINLGRKQSIETKKIMSEKFKGKNNPRYGKGYLMSGKNHPMFGKHHTKEAKRKIREARKKQILPIKDTSIEIKIQNFLKELEIEFFTHQYMKIEHGYQCDILIPSKNLVIECDGNYWHKYPIGRKIDKIRTLELLEKGFKVLRLWEQEINKITLKQFGGKLNE